VAEERYGITNTLVWPRNDLLVVGDTPENRLYAYPITGPGQLGPRRLFVQGPERGRPDGSCTDALGRVWNARVIGGEALACFSPEGELETLHDLPCL
jgi:sugar lactone lactonase YvrE